MSITARRPEDADADTPEPDAAAGTTGTKGSRGTKGAKGATGAKALKAPKTPKTPKAPKTPKTAPGPKRTSAPGPKTAGPRKEGLTVGSEPRVDLLPPEVRAERRNARTRRGFGWGVLAVLLVVLIAAGGAFSLNVLSQANLIAARSETASVLAQQQRFASVRGVQKQVALAEAAEQAGGSTEIDWKALLDQVTVAQPAGLTLSTLAVDSVSPIALYQQSADPLQGPRVGTVTVVGVSATLPNVPAWVAALQKIPGVVDVVPGTVSLDEVNNVYKATVTIHVSDSLYTKRFEPKGQ